MRDWSRQALPPRCDMCAERKVDVLRFGLVRRSRKPDKTQTTLGAGGIWLCEKCWRTLTPVRQRERAHPLRRSA